MPGPTAATMQDVLNLIPVLPPGNVNQALVASLESQISAAQTQLATDNLNVGAASAAITSDTATIQQLQQQLAAAQAKLASDQAALLTAQNAVTADMASIATLQTNLAAAQKGSPPANQSTAIKSGNWSDPTIWDQPQQDGFNAIVPAGIDVAFDAVTPRLKGVLVEGGLDLQNGHLFFDTLIFNMATLTLGTPTVPHAGQVNWTITDSGPIDTTKDPTMVGRGVILMDSTVGLYGRKVTERCFTTGNKAGDSTVTLTNPCNWKQGDMCCYPGILPGQDEDIPIQSVSADGLTITLSSPLLHDHPLVDIKGKPVDMCVVNSTLRSFDVVSENTTDTLRRGHWMVMYDPSNTMSTYHVEHVSLRGLGRTDKSKPVTDPDGLGNGLSNPRARYSHHFHRCGPNLLDANGNPRMMREIYSCLIRSLVATPGPALWAEVNHDSLEDGDSNIIIGPYAAGRVTEIGTETTCVCDNTVINCTVSQHIGNGVSDDLGNANWGRDGHCYWFQGGVVQSNGKNLSFGTSAEAVVFQGLPFKLNGVEAQFDSKNLPAQYKYAPGGLIPNGGFGFNIPQTISGFHGWNCKAGFVVWAFNGNSPAATSMTPLIGRSTFSDLHFSCLTGGLEQGYISGCDFINPYFCNATNSHQGTGISHTGVNTNCTFTNPTVLGFDVAMHGGTDGSVPIANLTHDCLTGIYIRNADQLPRTLAITNVTMIPLSASDQAAVAKFGFWDTAFFSRIQGKKQVNILMRMDMADDSIYEMFFPNVMQGIRTPEVQHDTVTLDGNRLWFPEMVQSFVPSALAPSPLQPTPVATMPSIAADFLALVGQSLAQIYATYGMAVADTVVPPDAVPVPNCIAFTSNTPPTLLPRMDVNKASATNGYEPSNYQQTSNPTGYVATVHDSKGNVVSFPPVNLTDKAWNLVSGMVEGFTRSVAVECDSSKTFPSNW